MLDVSGLQPGRSYTSGLAEKLIGFITPTTSFDPAPKSSLPERGFPLHLNMAVDNNGHTRIFASHLTSDYQLSFRPMDNVVDGK